VSATDHGRVTLPPNRPSHVRIDPMPDETAIAPTMPERIASRFGAITAEVQKVIDEANQKLVTRIPQEDIL
jgi:hypothetical protein